MQICAPTNFDDNLLPRIARLGVYEIYGKLASDYVGGGRSSHILRPVNWKKLEKHVSLAHSLGMRFNYLLNAVTLDARETTRQGYRAIRALLDKVCEIGANGVTVANPLLLKIIKTHYPFLEVKVSAFANVATPMQATHWADLGADILTPSPILVNREFKILAAMRKAFPGKIQLVVNNNCLFSCPFYHIHTNLVSTTSQSWHWSKGYLVDYCVFGCRLLRLSNPVLYIKGDWIRPEDLHVYERYGIDQIKVVNRSNPTDVIVDRVKAYASRSYNGNLLELVEHAKDHKRLGRQDLRTAARTLRTFFRPEIVNPVRLKELQRLILDERPVLEIENKELDGFIDHFINFSCQEHNCSDCTYCDRVAQRVVKVNEMRFEEFRKRYERAYRLLVDGTIFSWL